MLCANAMLGGQPKTELLCAHFFHTECLILHWYDQEMCCPSCHMNVFNTHIRTEAITRGQTSRNNREQKFLEEYNQNKVLKQDIKLLKKQVTKVRRAKAGFCKVGNQKRREWKQEIRPLFQLLKVKQKDMLRTVQMCPELKVWRAERAKLTRLENRFEATHAHYTIRNLLDYPSLKLPNLYDYRGLSSIYRWTTQRLFRLYM